MRKIKVSVWVVLLFVVALALNKFLLVLNYLLALLLHELAHVFVALNKGYKLKQFRFDIFGFSVELDAEIDESDCFFVNLAGPMCNVLICVLCLGLFWLFPSCYVALKTFCFCNFVLAVFNLLPIYPLDGGKVFRGLIKNDRAYNILSRAIKWLACFGFFVAFVVSAVCKNINFYFLIFALFFLFNRPEENIKFSLFKTKKEKRILKVKIFKLDETSTLLDAVKKIKHDVYTVFYVRGQVDKFVDEDALVDLCLKNNLTKKFCEL